MQGPKSRSNSAEVRQRTCPPTKLSRQQVVRSESSSSSNSPSTRSPNRVSAKMDHRSPASSERGSQKKQPAKLTELEEELKQVKDELITSELSKKRIQQEAEEAKKQLIILSEKLDETESQLNESSSLEESRIFELRKLSQERDRAWQNELEAMQKQHSLDSVALATAMNEIFKLKGLVREREKERDVARTELGASKGTIDSLLVEGSKLMDSFGAVVRELEESRVQVKMLEEKLSRTEKGENKLSHEEIEILEIKLHEEEILRTVQLQCIFEFIEQMKIESNERERKLEEAANSAKSEVMLLKASLFDKDCEVRKIMDMNKKNEAEAEAEAEAELNLNLTKLKEELGEKKRELDNVLHENDLLRVELAKLSMEKDKICEQAMNEKNSAIKAQKEALTKLEMAIEEMKENKEKASVVNEELDSVQNMKAEMEMELRKLRIQADQWKKAAETAMTLLTVGSKDKLIERTESLNSNSNLSSISGKFGSLDFSDELNDEPLSRKNGNVLKKISGMWKK